MLSIPIFASMKRIYLRKKKLISKHYKKVFLFLFSSNYIKMDTFMRFNSTSSIIFSLSRGTWAAFKTMSVFAARAFGKILWAVVRCVGEISWFAGKRTVGCLMDITSILRAEAKKSIRG